jgi:hypothetical protein
MYSGDITGIPEEGDVNMPPPAPQEHEGRLGGRKVRAKAKKAEKIPEPPKVPLVSSGKRMKGTRKVSSTIPKRIRPRAALESLSQPIPRKHLSRTQVEMLVEKARQGKEGPEMLALRQPPFAATERRKISRLKQARESARSVPQMGNTAEVFAAPRTPPLSLWQFQQQVQMVLSSPLKENLTKDTLDDVLHEGEQQIKKLIDKKKFSEARQLTEKLLQINPTTQKIKYFMLHLLIETGNRQGSMLYAAQLVKDPSCSEEFKAFICDYLASICLRNCDFPQSIEFGEQLLQILSQKPDLASKYDMAAIQQSIDLAKKRLTQYSAVNDTRTPRSPIAGLSKSQYELLQLLKTTRQLLGTDQEVLFNDFLTFCLGNKALSKTLREMSEIPGRLKVVNATFLPSNLVGTSGETVRSTKKVEAQATSVNYEQLSLAALAKEFSILSYKTQEENIEKFMKATEKLSAIFEKVDQRRDFQAFAGLVESFQDPEVKPLYGPSVAQVYSQAQIAEAQKKFAARRAAIEDTSIAQSDKLTGADLEALNSLISLTHTLEGYQHDGLLTNNHFVSIIIKRGKQAELLVERLIELLGSSYQTGDLSFRNLGKFDALTGKSQGWMMKLYSYTTPFGHAAMIDQTMDLQTIAYSEVIGQYTYRTVPLEEFLTTDIYRVNIPSLVSLLGMGILTQRLKILKEKGLVSPILTVEQLIQTTFNSHLEAILSGTTEIPIAIEMPTKRPEEAQSEQEKAELQQAWKEYETRSAKIEKQRMKTVQQHHRTAFGTIKNDGMLQVRAGISPFHRPVNLPWQSTPQGLDFKSMDFEGQMICSQFQALALLKALALTRESLYEMMAEYIARDLAAPVPMEDIVPVSKAPSEEVGETAEPAKTIKQQAEFSTALEQVKQMNLFTIPVSELEKPHLLTPSRVISLFREHLVPVPLAPIAREILDLPEQFYGTALFGTQRL